MNKREHSHIPATQPPAPFIQEPDELEADELMQHLQSVWDEHMRRVDEIIQNSGEPLLRVNPEYFQAMERRLRRERIAVAAVSLCTAVCAAIAYLHNTDRILRITFCLITAAALAVATVCLLRLLLSSRRQPYATAGSAAAAFTQLDRLSSSFTSMRQTLTITLAIMATLATTACVPAGDGHTISSTNYTERAAVITAIDTLINTAAQQS